MNYKDKNQKDTVLYFYRNKNGNKDRKKGIIKYQKVAWNLFEENKTEFIKANKTEIQLFRLRLFFLPFLSKIKDIQTKDIIIILLMIITIVVSIVAVLKK